MDADVAELVTRGRSALRSGDWASARACLAGAAQMREDPVVLDGLAQALFSLGGAIDRAQEAFAAFRAQGEHARAALCARFVGYLYWVVHGDGAVMSGWMSRAVGEIEAAGDCPERARIELTLATVTADPVARERHLSSALDLARRHGATDLVLDASSLRGLHLVAAGDVTAGMALLDEALAAVAAGEVQDLLSVGAMYCKMLHACEMTSDVRRAEDWMALADGFVERTGRIPISAICRTHYGGVLTAAGRWAEAERELATSVALYDRSYRALRSAAVVRLAGLRVRQGRLEEAALLLDGADHDSHAIRPRVELHLSRGEADLALARIERFFRAHPHSELTASVLLLLVRAHLARGDLAGAARASGRLSGTASGSAHPAAGALAAHAAGLVAAAQRAPEATGLLEAAVAAFSALGLPFEEARARLDLAGVLADADPAIALVEARAALRTFQRLPAGHEADAATSLLRRLGVRGHTGPRGAGTLTTREEEVLRLLGHGYSNADIAARLFLSRRTVEHHVSNILAKLGLSGRAEAAAFLVRSAAVSPDRPSRPRPG